MSAKFGGGTDASGPGGIAARIGPVLAALVVIAIYGVVACTADSELGSRTAREDYYNRLVDGFDRGRLSLDLTPPAWLVALPNPYDPKANAPWQGQRFSSGRIHDLSYYRGRLYLYFSVIPALILFLPFHGLTGAYLAHRQACFVFASVGFLAAAFLIDSIRRRYFSRTGPAAGSLATLCVGLIPVVPIVLERSDVWEVPIVAAYAFWMLALLSLWHYLRRPAQSWPSLLGASASVGLAIGCRPNGCLGAALLLLPLFRILRRDPAGERRGRARAAAALILPIAAIAIGLLAYNYARFGNIAEFGQKYQISGGDEDSVRRFSARFFWYDFRLYFLEYPGWQKAFPFVQELSPPPMPAGHRAGDNTVGVLTLLPFILCAAALPWGMRVRREQQREPLAAIVASLLLLFLSAAVPLCLFISTCLRYELEFVPALVLLAVIGFLAVASDFALPRRLRWGLIGAGTAAAAASIAFSLLMTADLRANTYAGHGMVDAQSDRTDEAIGLYRRALLLRPGNPVARIGLADMFVREKKFAEAVAALRKAAILVPDSPTIHVNTAYCLYQLGRLDEAMAECELALGLQPGSADAKNMEREIRAAK